MAKYIDADALAAKLDRALSWLQGLDGAEAEQKLLQYIKAKLEQLPAADVEPAPQAPTPEKRRVYRDHTVTTDKDLAVHLMACGWDIDRVQESDAGKQYSLYKEAPICNFC